MLLEDNLVTYIKSLWGIMAKIRMEMIRAQTPPSL